MTPLPGPAVASGQSAPLRLGSSQLFASWHQHHALYRPPYPHFEAIVTNARRFHARWGRWCMDYWLAMFRDAGLIDWSPTAGDIVVRRRPSAEETRAARLDGEVRYG